MNGDLSLELGKIIKDKSILSNWDSSMSSFPANNIKYLGMDYLTNANKILNLDKKALQVLIDHAGKISKNLFLKQLYWHYCITLSNLEKNFDPWTFCFPSLNGMYGIDSGVFGLLALLSRLDSLIVHYSNSGITEDILRDTLSDINLWMNKYYNENGHWGFSQSNWLLLHMTGRLYRLGRLQFSMEYMNTPLRAYKHKNSNEIIAFFEKGIKIRQDGLIDGTNSICDPLCWSAEFNENHDKITGNPIKSIGKVEKSLLVLDSSDYNLALKAGDPVLDVHIPEGEKLELESCLISFSKAQKFFSTTFPEFDFKAFVCYTWLFDWQLSNILPPESNIVKFQRLFYLFPVKSDDIQMFERVFGVRHKDLDKIQLKTSLQKHLAEYLQKGNKMSNAGGFIIRSQIHVI
ncbi:MAG: acyltransferase domain-containing protein [Clostridia bacterium]|nr:acyltransferase domain-containing protein [Clostridia bacterium]